MKLENTFNSLVILGSWNRRIFTEEWVKEHIFPETNDEFKIDILLMNDSDIPSLATRISSDKISILIQDHKLTFNTVDDKEEYFECLIELTKCAADILPHTPITAYGVNFHFSENDIDDDIINLLRPKDLEKFKSLGLELTSERYTRSLSLDGQTINITTDIIDTQADFDFNFHFDIPNMIALKNSISAISILGLKHEAIRIITNTYNFEIEEERID